MRFTDGSEELLTRTSDASGNVVLPVGTWSVEPMVGYRFSESEFELAEDDARIVWVSRESILKVSVENPGGAPIQGAFLRWEPSGSWRDEAFDPWENEARVTTDATGRASLELDGGHSGGRLLVWATGHRPTQRAVREVDLEHVLRIPLERVRDESVAALTFVHPDGSPAGEVVVSADLATIDGHDGGCVRIGESDAAGRVDVPGWAEACGRLHISGRAARTVGSREGEWSDRTITVTELVPGTLVLEGMPGGLAVQVLVTEDGSRPTTDGVTLDAYGGTLTTD